MEIINITKFRFNFTIFDFIIDLSCIDTIKPIKPTISNTIPAISVKTMYRSWIKKLSFLI